MRCKGVTILMTVFILFTACKDKAVEEAALIRPVLYQEVGYLGGENSRTFSGTARTEKIINLSFRSSGIITFFDLKIGQQVKKATCWHDWIMYRHA